jgi:hypothetical protein
MAALVLCGGLLAGGCSGITITVQQAAPAGAAAGTDAVTVAALGTETSASAVVSDTEASAVTATPAYTTPEAAIEAYMQGIAAGDVQAIFAASAIDEAALGFDFISYVERMQAMPLLTSPAPAEYPLYAEMNRERRQNDVLTFVRNFAYSLLSAEDVEDGLIAQPGAERTAAFVAAVDPQRLSGVEVLKIGVPEPDILNGEQYQKNAGQIARIFGADEMTERVALLEFEGKTYLLGFMLLRYGEEWKVMSQTSTLAGTSGMGTVVEISAPGFAEVTGEE